MIWSAIVVKKEWMCGGRGESESYVVRLAVERTRVERTRVARWRRGKRELRKSGDEAREKLSLTMSTREY